MYTCYSIRQVPTDWSPSLATTLIWVFPIYRATILSMFNLFGKAIFGFSQTLSCLTRTLSLSTKTSNGSGSITFDMRPVGSAIFSLSLGLENFPSGQKKSHLVRSKSTRVKPGSASYLLRVKSMLGSGQAPSLTIMEAQAFSFSVLFSYMTLNLGFLISGCHRI